jgi:Zn-dependent protease with chaperone function
MTHWSRPAWTIQPGSPVVAVAGVFRPQLFVARQVVTSCTAGELAAIAAHEATHVSARDNLVRGLFRLTPGAGIFRHLADRLERDWNAAAEEAADLLGSRSTSPLDLASALTKVARLATSAPARSLVVSALIGGSDLQARVRRLLEAPAPPRRHPAVWIPAIGLMAAATIVQSAPMLAVVHEFFELLVRH